MVAVVKAGKSLRNILNYNEQKTKLIIDPVKQIRAAELIHSSGYAKDTSQLVMSDKLGTLQKLTELNERTTVNSIHISLNFHPSEQGMPNQQLQDIADAYMQKLGFGEQPYLVYKHNDSSHPHIHIVTTNIKANGKRIKLHNIGRDKSEKARKEIEQQFNLVRADKHQRQELFELKPLNAARLQYGKSPATGTKRAITNVLDHVLPRYKYTSLPELNAVLKNYNVVAHQGGKGSRTFERNGLYYQVLDDKGKPTGVPIPASDFYNKPTMARLQEDFVRNDKERQPYKRRIKNAIDLSLQKLPAPSIQELQQRLQKEQIQMVLRQNDQGVIYGITYIDHQKKAVFNGSDLGKDYSANRIQQRCQSTATSNDLSNKQQHGQEQEPQPPVQRQPLPTAKYPKTSHHIQLSTKDNDQHHLPDHNDHPNSKSTPNDQGSLPPELSTNARKRRRRRKFRH